MTRAVTHASLAKNGSPGNPLIDKAIKTVCIGLAVLTLLALSLGYFYKKGEGELPVYTTAIERMVDGSEIYRRDDGKAFTYPPFAAVPFLPFLALPTELHPALWYIVYICVFFYVFRRLHLLVVDWAPGQSNRKQRRIFWIILMLLVARHLSSVFESKANDILMLLLMFEAARLAADQRYRLVGMWAGVAAAFKATPWLFLPVLVWQRRFIAAAILLAAAIAAHLIPDLLFPRSARGSWTMSWYSTFLADVSLDKPVDAEGAWTAWNHLNQSLTATLYRLSTPFDPSAVHALNINLWQLEGKSLSVLNIAAQLTVLLLVVIATKPIASSTGLQRFGQVGAVLCGMLLLSPMSSKSHFAVLIIPLSFCVMEFLRDLRRMVIGIHLGVVFLMGTLTSKGIIGKDLGNQVLALGSVTWITLATLTATTYALHRKPIAAQHNG